MLDDASGCRCRGPLEASRYRLIDSSLSPLISPLRVARKYFLATRFFCQNNSNQNVLFVISMYMEENMTLPADIEACQRLIVELSAQLREIEERVLAGESQLENASLPIAAAPLGDTAAQLSSLTAQINSLTAELEGCRALLEEQARTILEMQQVRLKLEQANEKLQLLVNKLVQQCYGRRSERFVEDPTQQKMDFGDDPPTDDQKETDKIQADVAEAEKVIEKIEERRKAAKQKQKPKPQSGTFPDHLPRIEIVVDAPDDKKNCTTHGPRVLFGYDTVETLRFTRPELYVEVAKFPKYICQGQPTCGVQQPDRPVGLVAGNRFDTGLGVEVVIQKYAFHLPYYRQQDFFGSLGWVPTRSTLQNIVTAVESQFFPLVQYFRKCVFEGKAIGCDDTTVTLIVPPVIPSIDPNHPRSARIAEVFTLAHEKDHPSVTARMWAYRGVDVPLNIFDFTVSRHRDGPDDVLGNFSGTLIGDCWTGFQKIEVRSDSRIIHAACWAHARRKVFDGRSSEPLVASLFLALIHQLYDIEDRAKSLTAAERLTLRQAESIPLLARLRAVIDGPVCATVLPKSNFGAALVYLRNNWEALLVFSTDGMIPIDNNAVERLMKQVAIGRKNWLFVGSVDAGNRTATLLTMVSSAMRHDLDVYAYLKDVLDQLLAGSTNYHSMRPDVWKLTHPEHIRAYRQDERQEASDRRSCHRAARRIAAAKEASGKLKASSSTTDNTTDKSPGNQLALPAPSPEPNTVPNTEPTTESKSKPKSNNTK